MDSVLRVCPQRGTAGDDRNVCVGQRGRDERTSIISNNNLPLRLDSSMGAICYLLFARAGRIDWRTRGFVARAFVSLGRRFSMNPTASQRPTVLLKEKRVMRMFVYIRPRASCRPRAHRGSTQALVKKYPASSVLGSEVFASSHLQSVPFTCP
jgi:hypothetical protein